MSELDFSVLGTSVSCDERRPTDSGGSWCTDFSVDKVILRLEFEGRCFFDTIRIINNNASHIEVRGGEKSNSPWYDSRKVVEKTLLRNMWDHKTNKNNNSTNLLICSKEFSYQELLIGLYNNWEPPSRIGLESFSIRGRLDGNPQEYTAYSPPVKNGPKIVNSSAGPDPVVVSESKIMSAWCSQPSEARIEQKRKNEITSDVKVSKINTPQSLDLPKPKPKTISNPTVPNVQQIPPPPPGKPLAGVTICLSGYKNPERSNLRDQALKLGAKCADDWSNGGTHLVCAYANTPKYLEVEKEGNGHIVTKDWIGVAAASGSRPNELLYQLRKKGKPY